MSVKTSPARPYGPVAKWSQSQAARWIREQAKLGNVRFSFHAKSERGVQYAISPDEQLDAIRRGRVLRWEPSTVPKTREPNMTMTFELVQRTRKVGVVVAAIDSDPAIVAVTTWENPL